VHNIHINVYKNNILRLLQSIKLLQTNKHCELPYRITDNSLYMLWQQTLWVAIQDYRQQPIHVTTTNIVSCHTGLQTTAYTCYDNKHCELPYRITDNSLYMLWQQTLWVAIQDYRQQPIHAITTNIVSCHTGLQTTAYTCYDLSCYCIWQLSLMGRTIPVINEIFLKVRCYFFLHNIVQTFI
jgi:hemolysin-activating ACP:hemolysin acyltransferase